MDIMLTILSIPFAILLIVYLVTSIGYLFLFAVPVLFIGAVYVHVVEARLKGARGSQDDDKHHKV